MKKLLTLAFVLATTLLFGQVEIPEISKIEPEKIENDSLKITKTFFYDGNIKTETTIGKKDLKGSKTVYSNNGYKHYIEEFIVSELKSNHHLNSKLISAWDKNNKQTVINGNGTYFFENDKKQIIGNIVDGQKSGVWKTQENEMTYSDYFEKGKFISGTKKDSNNKISIYKKLKSQTKFTKGFQIFNYYNSENYRKANPIKNIKGKMLVEFVVDVDGTLKDFKIITSIASEIDKQAIDLLSKYKDITPGYQRGEPVRVVYKLPLTFSLK